MLEIAKYFCLIYKYICIIYTSIHFIKIILNIMYLKKDETININFIDKKGNVSSENSFTIKVNTTIKDKLIYIWNTYF